VWLFNDDESELWCADLFEATPEDARLLYVALTRAEDHLFVTHSGPSAFVERIRQSGKAVEYHAGPARREGPA
jgi:superfamily I DNA/RNA helicase